MAATGAGPAPDKPEKAQATVGSMEAEVSLGFDYTFEPTAQVAVASGCAFG
jgi:hypothetical protein